MPITLILTPTPRIFSPSYGPARYRHVLMSQRQIDSDLIRIRFNADWIDRGNEVRNLLQRIRILNLRNLDM